MYPFDNPYLISQSLTVWASNLEYKSLYCIDCRAIQEDEISRQKATPLAFLNIILKYRSGCAKQLIIKV
jgi:hypothetical protein